MTTRRFTEIYFDNNATTRPHPEVRDAMLDALGPNFGNPSSAHSTGDRARNLVLTAKESVGKLIGVDPVGMVVTAGGTEANNIVLKSVLGAPGPRRIVTTRVEHSSVLKACEDLADRGVDVRYLPVHSGGRVDLDEIVEAISSETSLVSVQWVNSETGVIQPVETIGEICHGAGVPFHVDAAQAAGKVDIDLSRLPIDFLTLTAHKFHGPQGVGLLYAKNRRWLAPLCHGGPQESGIRPGTENVPGIVGLGVAAALRFDRLRRVRQQLQSLRDRFEQLILDHIPDTCINGAPEDRVSNTSNLRFRGVDGQALVAQLDQVGIRTSQSSACTNRYPEPSYVLRAMGLTEDEAYSSVRFALSETNSLDDVHRVVERLEEIVLKLRAFGRKSIVLT